MPHTCLCLANHPMLYPLTFCLILVCCWDVFSSFSILLNTCHVERPYVTRISTFYTHCNGLRGRAGGCFPACTKTHLLSLDPPYLRRAYLGLPSLTAGCLTPCLPACLTRTMRTTTSHTPQRPRRCALLKEHLEGIVCLLSLAFFATAAPPRWRLPLYAGVSIISRTARNATKFRRRTRTAACLPSHIFLVYLCAGGASPLHL